MWGFWLVVAGIFFIIELCTTGFLVFWLGLAALISMIVSFFTTNIVIQTILFVALSIILIVFTRPILNKFFKLKDDSSLQSNIYSVIGKEGIVVEDINCIDYTGKVKVAGELWSAISNNDIPKNTHIKVTEIDGVKLKVEPINVTLNVQ